MLIKDIKPIDKNGRNFLKDKESETLIDEFIELSQIEDVLSTKLKSDSTKTNPAGYTNAIHATDKPFYLAIAYHEFYLNMGIVVKFSAWAWAEYQSNYYNLHSVHITLSEFLKMIESNIYSFRLSRIDIAVDYKNYFESNFLDTLNEDIKNNVIKVVNVNDIKSFQSSSAITNDNKISTIYLGSRKSNTRSFLRIYDKKQEQLNNNGFRMAEAKECESWIRFEASYRSIYAHKVTDELIKTNNYA